MAAASRAFSGGTVIATALVAASLAGFAGHAHAAPALFKRLFAFGRSGDGQIAAPATARFLSDDGGTFILDRSQKKPLLKFNDSSEVWALSPSRGPRGDIIYANDLGEPFLRATKLGGMTVFTDSHPEGSAVSLMGPCNRLILPPLGPAKLWRWLYADSVQTTRAAQHLVGFYAPDADASSDGLIADAASIALDAVVSLSARAGGRALLARLNKVAIIPGAKPGVAVQRGVLAITIVPTEGFAGRPSSEWVLRALEGR
jgi:hypothetical protein